MKRWLCVLVMVMLLPVAGVAEESTGMTAEDVVARMGIGWNLGNTFDATGGNTSDVYSQEKSMGNPKVTAELIRKVKAAGFTTIRIPVTWYRGRSRLRKWDDVTVGRGSGACTEKFGAVLQKQPGGDVHPAVESGLIAGIIVKLQ